MKRISVIVLLSGCVIGLLGCASLEERAKGFLAISTREIEGARDKAIVKVVDYEYSDCYKKVEATLIEIGSYIYTQNKEMIAVYISETDTTPAGVFFKEIDSYKTQVEIASPASDTKEYLVEKIFTALVRK